MDITKAPPLDVDPTRPGLMPAPQQGAASPPFAPLAPPQDRVDIQPLDVVAALQILIAEVRSELQLPPGALQPQTPTQTAQIVIQRLLDAVSDHAPDPVRWFEASTRADAAVRLALDRAVEAVAVWHNVPHAVVEASREARSIVAAQLSDEPQSPLWLRPEWLWLAPRIQRYWRRRRFARRGLTDPDLRHPGDGPGDRAEPQSS